MTTAAPRGAGTPAAPHLGVDDAAAMLRSPRYVVLLIAAAVIGVPIAAVAYWFLVLAGDLQRWLYTDLPRGLGLGASPSWWPIPVLVVGGLLVALTIRYLPGRGGESPVDGFQAGHVTAPVSIPGVAIAALVTLGFGAVLGPEAPLIALGGALALLALRLTRRNLPAQATMIVAAAGTFAAISTLLGSPLLGAFLLMEVAGVGGPTLGLVLLPGLLAAGVGTLIFVGFDSWTGHGTFSLALPNLPTFTRPDVAEFGWALAIGLAAAVLATAIRALARFIRRYVEPSMVLLTPVVGALVGALAMVYALATGKGTGDVLFSGQTSVGPLITNAAGNSLGAILLLLACKGLAYSLSLSAFRGGPVFPSIFLGAAAGIALAHIPGLPLVPAVAMGIGAMTVSMLRLPLTSVMLATVLLFSDGLAVTPLVIVAVVVAHVSCAVLTRPRKRGPQAADPSSSATDEPRSAPSAAVAHSKPAPEQEHA